MITVNFIEVGRDRKSWSKQYSSKSVSCSAIAKEAKLVGRLMSSSVEAEIEDNGATGLIIVGGYRPVGSFTISREDAP